MENRIEELLKEYFKEYSFYTQLVKGTEKILKENDDKELKVSLEKNKEIKNIMQGFLEDLYKTIKQDVKEENIELDMAAYFFHQFKGAKVKFGSEKFDEKAIKYIQSLV
ncbi:hypothetical protein DP124_12135 [Clostridium tetani]|uniref:HPt domain-containing protein n=1 Tax=Clostridium tetani TaxID=1513 RepID=A0ABC8EGC9_CLOTA|nr:hypothetical protein [Clostridium tetani]RXI50212.1 hypothetical protein DP124_12135 [Clostridium tetani]RXI57276.1 hypothetical protein DP122_00405 [Clostridium tetani]BDR82575.1 hypothetical protein K234311028_p20580 [Clostridium tetani]